MRLEIGPWRALLECKHRPSIRVRLTCLIGCDDDNDDDGGDDDDDANDDDDDDDDDHDDDDDDVPTGSFPPILRHFGSLHSTMAYEIWNRTSQNINF